jgi:hypothetical protein
MKTVLRARVPCPVKASFGPFLRCPKVQMAGSLLKPAFSYSYCSFNSRPTGRKLISTGRLIMQTVFLSFLPVEISCTRFYCRFNRGKDHSHRYREGKPAAGCLWPVEGGALRADNSITCIALPGPPPQAFNCPKGTFPSFHYSITPSPQSIVSAAS